MLPALPRTLFGPTFLAPATAALASGCNAADGGIALGIGLAVVSTGAWAAYRRLVASPTSPAPPPALGTSTPFVPSSEAMVRTILEQRYPIFKEAAYGIVSKTVAQRVTRAMGPSWQHPLVDRLIKEQIRGLILDLRNFKHTPVTQRLWNALDPHLRLFDELSDANAEVVSRAVRQLMKIAYYQDPLPPPPFILVPLRFVVMSKKSPSKLALDGLLTLEAIAAPARRPYTWNPRLSETALGILFYDGLAHKNPELAAKARGAMARVLQRRPEIVTEDMRKALKVPSA